MVLLQERLALTWKFIVWCNHKDQLITPTTSIIHGIWASCSSLTCPEAHLVVCGHSTHLLTSTRLTKNMSVITTSALINWLYNLSLWRGKKRDYIINIFWKNWTLIKYNCFSRLNITTSSCTSKYCLSSNVVSVKRYKCIDLK